MTMYKNIIRLYCQALLENDYQTMISLFSGDARVFSFLAGEKPPSEFYRNLFAVSRRTNVELKNVFIDFDNKTTAAAYICIESILKENITLKVEAVDIFEFDSEHKIKTLKIILDTYPLRMLKMSE